MRFEPTFAKLNGATIALIAFTDNEPQWEATADREGIAYVPVDVTDDRAQELFAKIGAAKNAARRLSCRRIGDQTGATILPRSISVLHIA